MAKRQSSLSLSLKGARTSSLTSSPSRSGIYLSNISTPKGIQNAGNTCYASSVFQCLLNHGQFMNRMRYIAENHTNEECTMCHSGSMIIAFIYRIAGKFGERFNLAIWRILARIAKLKIAKINLWRAIRTRTPNRTRAGNLA